MPRSPAARAALMLVLLSVAALPPPAQAQVPAGAALCFPDADPPPATPPATANPRGCPGGVPAVPNFLQGGPIRIRLENVRPETTAADPPWVRVTCLTNCHDNAPGEVRHYWARWRGTTLQFPYDFREPSPETGEPLRDAQADLAPRYNGTWQVTAFVAGQTLERSFNVWLFTRYASSGLVVQPGETHDFRSSGLEPSATVAFRIERISTDGKWAAIPLPDAPPTRPINGVFIYSWRVLPQEATRIAECPRTVLDCYRAVVDVSNSAKKDEVIHFRVSTATLRFVPEFVPGGDPQRKERTDVVGVHVSLRYPSIGHDVGYALIPEHLEPVPNDTPTLRLMVERDNRTGEPPTVVDALTLRYDSRHTRWAGQWTIPKDMPLYPSAVYRARLVEARDQWGNLVPSVVASNYTVAEAVIDPVVELQPIDLARAEEGVVSLSVRYHNGTPISPADLGDVLRGCWVREGGLPCSNTTASGVQEGVFEKQSWVFRKTFPIGHDRLGDHRFVLLGGASVRDAYGNRINGTSTVPFELHEGSQWIDFSTVQRGRATTTLERGELIHVVATITYADGTPYNETVRPYHLQPDSAPPEFNPRVLLVNVTKRGPRDDVHSLAQLELRQADVERGIWQGTLPLTLGDELTPTGRWTFGLDVKDNFTVPNVNRTSFERTIVPAPLRFEARSLTTTSPPTGSTIAFSFGLRYENGAPVTGLDVKPSGVVAQVFKYDPRLRLPVGDPLSSQIPAQYDAPGHAGQWSLRYLVPPHLFNGPYVLVLTGADVSGNKLPQDAFSREFTPFSPHVDRAIVAPKENTTVRRGETATFIVAAEDGDVGLDGTGKPAISVERWNENARRWDPVAGASNVRVDTEDALTHVGQLPIVTTTPIGTYRFRFLGRDVPGYRVIEAYSPNFTVLPTEVVRSVLELPPPVATKGDTLWFTVEYRPGDRYSDLALYERSQRLRFTAPYTSLEGGHVNVTWKVPFETPSGNYTIRLDGHDQHGNELHVESPVIEVRSAQLVGRVLGSPARTVERGTDARFFFGITYPNGDFYRETTPPVVLVRTAARVVGTATVAPRDLTFEATWRPPAEAELGEHWFEVSSEGGSNSFPTLRSSSFRVQPGDLARPAPTDVQTARERFETQTWTLPVSVDDRNVTFWLDYYGPGADLERAVRDLPPLTTTALQHTLQADQASYVVRWTTDALTSVGTYRFRMEGEDRFANQLKAVSNPFTLRTTSMVVEWRSAPAEADFGEGKTLEFTFGMRYKNGAPVDPSNFRPAPIVLLERIPATPEPTLAYEAGLWRMTWAAPETLAPGGYTFALEGFDVAGNELASARSTTYVHKTSVPESFAKEVPLPGLAALLAALVLVALLARRPRGR